MMRNQRFSRLHLLRAILKLGSLVALFGALAGAPLATVTAIGLLTVVDCPSLATIDAPSLTAVGDLTIRHWSRDAAAPLRSLEGHDLNISALALDPEEARLCSGARDTTIRSAPPHSSQPAER